MGSGARSYGNGSPYDYGQLSLGYGGGDGSSTRGSVGSTYSGSISLSGTLGGQIVPTFPGLYVSGGINAGLTTKGQIYFQLQANGMTGVGYYAGIGGSVSGGASNGDLLKFYSDDRALHVEGNVGWGGSTGYSIDKSKESLSVGIATKFGVGYGAMQGAGVSQTVTIAPFSPLW